MQKNSIKKLLILGLALMAVTCTIAAVSADDVAANKTIENGTLTLGGLQFKIPTGFTEVESDQDTSTGGDTEHMEGTAVDTEISSEFVNGGEKLNIKVGSKNNGSIDSINLPNAQKKTIAGKDGYFWTEMDDGKTEYKFEYLQDGKIVKIETYNEDLISQVI
ncbi:MAG: hypothetical protein BZ138_03745 [Methanosphaera sp. rholeuAM270]|nr:MAG: hypothetical protein BZ138_03745 [Methanosphaera sp. rholeuAM270]